MPVTVECQVTSSKRRWVYVWGLTMMASTCFYFISMPFWLCFLWVILPWLAYRHWLSEPDVSKVRFSGDVFDVWTESGMEKFDWRGEGRLSHAYIRFDLIDAEMNKMTLLIWKDSVSPVSWRALNMAYRVILPGILKKQSESLGVN